MVFVKPHMLAERVKATFTILVQWFSMSLTVLNMAALMDLTSAVKQLLPLVMHLYVVSIGLLMPMPCILSCPRLLIFLLGVFFFFLISFPICHTQE